MNEDARDEDTVVGRALGTVAVIGLSALGVGIGAHLTGKALGKAAKSAKKGIKQAADAMFHETTTLSSKINLPKAEQEVTTAVIHKSPAISKNVKIQGTNKYGAGEPVKKSLRMRDKAAKNSERMWEQNKDKFHDSFKNFMDNEIASEMKKEQFLDGKIGLQGADSLTRKRIIENAEKMKQAKRKEYEDMWSNLLEEPNRLAEQYQKGQEALGEEIDNTISNMNKKYTKPKKQNNNVRTDYILKQNREAATNAAADAYQREQEALGEEIENSIKNMNNKTNTTQQEQPKTNTVNKNNTKKRRKKKINNDALTKSAIEQNNSKGHSKSRWKQYLRDNPDNAKGILATMSAPDTRKPVLKDKGKKAQKFFTGESNNIEDLFAYNKESLLNPYKPEGVHAAFNINDIINLNESREFNGKKLDKEGFKKSSKKMMNNINSSKDFVDDALKFKVDPNSNDMVTVIHGGSKERINSFLKTGNGSYPTETAMLQNNGKVEAAGFQFHSQNTGRAIDYANRTAGYANPAVLVAQVPKNELYFNANGNKDEYMFPRSAWNKIQNPRVYTPDSKEWINENFYNEEDKKHILDWAVEGKKYKK